MKHLRGEKKVYGKHLLTWIFEVIKFKTNLEIDIAVLKKQMNPTQKIKMTSTNLAFEPIGCCI